MNWMFTNSVFNGDISRWNVANVVEMQGMFAGAAFNTDISNWNTSSVLDIEMMFKNASFSKDVSKWNVSRCTNFQNVFPGSPFDGDLSQWRISKESAMEGLFDVECAHTLKAPNVYHWLLAIQGPDIMCKWPEKWKTHFLDCLAMVDCLGASSTHAAVLIQDAWHMSARNMEACKMQSFDFSGMV